MDNVTNNRKKGFKILPFLSKDFNDGVNTDSNNAKDIVMDTIKFSDDRCKSIERAREIELTRENPNREYIANLERQLADLIERNDEKADKAFKHSDGNSNKRAWVYGAGVGAVLALAGSQAKKIGKFAITNGPALLTKFIK